MAPRLQRHPHSARQPDGRGQEPSSRFLRRRPSPTARPHPPAVPLRLDPPGTHSRHAHRPRPPGPLRQDRRRLAEREQLGRPVLGRRDNPGDKPQGRPLISLRGGHRVPAPGVPGARPRAHLPAQRPRGPNPVPGLPHQGEERNMVGARDAGEEPPAHHSCPMGQAAQLRVRGRPARLRAIRSENHAQ